MPFSAHSFDMAFVTCITPPLLAAYGVIFLPPIKLIMEAMLMICRSQYQREPNFMDLPAFPGRPSAVVLTSAHTPIHHMRDIPSSFFANS